MYILFAPAVVSFLFIATVEVISQFRGSGRSNL